MINDKIKKDLKELTKYSNTAQILIDNIDKVLESEVYSKNPEFDDVLDSFHPINCGCIELDDDYLLGIRCNHLIWIEGWSECPDSSTLVVQGNHKGVYIIKIFYLPAEDE